MSSYIRYDQQGGKNAGARVGVVYGDYRSGSCVDVVIQWRVYFTGKREKRWIGVGRGKDRDGK